MNIIAKIISFVFHPIFMLSYVVVYFTFSNTPVAHFIPLREKNILLALTLLFSVIIPLLNIFILKKIGFLHDFKMQEAKQRIVPYISTMMLYFGLVYLFDNMHAILLFKQIAMVSLCIVFVDFVFNFFIKISAHASAIGGCLGIFYYYEKIFSINETLTTICGCLLLFGIVGSARLYLEAHTPKQLYAGFFIGFLVATLYFFYPII
ncbi:MAG: hypothetical protein JST67_08795 [Bacteroidetes bacterium]|nr:hypothetical protein [Bacteroidota bacterium]